MPEEESISVAPSEESGNISVETETEETPSEEIEETETPAEEEEEVISSEPEETLYELPDGRKVDAETLTREWKENFLPDYTRKSQALAEKENINNKPTDPLSDPNYVPKDAAELAELLEKRMFDKMEAKEQQRIEQERAVETMVEQQLAEVKKADPSLNENTLFQHANKYGFRDLKLAHQNMKDMGLLAKKVQKQTSANVAKRTDPVSTSPGATGSRPEPSQFASSQEYLAALKASGK